MTEQTSECLVALKRLILRNQKHKITLLENDPISWNLILYTHKELYLNCQITHENQDSIF
jgi:hypothetical protein